VGFVYKLSINCESATSCTGTITLSLVPNPANLSARIISTVSGLSSYSGKTAYIKQSSCSGTQKCSCSFSGSGCSCKFIDPTGTSTYYACVDKNTNGVYTDSGESVAKTLTVTNSPSAPTLISPSNGATVSTKPTLDWSSIVDQAVGVIFITRKALA